MKTYLRLIALFLLPIVFGCNLNPVNPPEGETIIADNVVVPEKHNSIANIAGHGDTLQIEFSNPTLPEVKSGDIIISASKGGFLRKVNKVLHSDGNSLILLTEPARLTDVIKKGRIDTVLSIQPQENIELGAIRKSSRLQGSDIPVITEIGRGYVRPDDIGIEIVFKDVQFIVGQDTVKIDKITFKGTLDIIIKADFDLSGVRYLNVTFDVRLGKTLKAGFERKASLLDDIKGEFPLPEIPLGLYVIPVGVAPIPIAVNFEPEIKISGTSPSVSISDMEIGAQANVKAGMEYSVGNFSPISDIQVEPVFNPPQLNINTEFFFELGAQGSILTKIAGVAGPGLALEPGGYLNYNVANACLEGGFYEKVNAAFEFEIFGVEFDLEAALYNRKIPFIQNCSGNSLPVINQFVATPSQGVAPLEVCFQYSASDPDSDKVNCILDFGDGKQVRLVNCSGKINHTYQNPGVYQASFQVRESGRGRFSSSEIRIFVAEQGVNSPPVVKLAAHPLSGDPPLEVTISYDVTDPDGDLIQAEISFGDGSQQPLTAPYGNITYTYTENGTYKITLTASDGKGGSTAKEVIVNVGTLNISGHWKGTLTQPNGPVVPVFDFEMNLTQKNSDIFGESLISVPGQPYYGKIALQGKVSGNTFTFQELQIIEQNPPPGKRWCIKSGTLDFDPSNESLTGTWTAPGCLPGEIKLNRQ